MAPKTPWRFLGVLCLLAVKLLVSIQRQDAKSAKKSAKQRFFPGEQRILAYYYRCHGGEIMTEKLHDGVTRRELFQIGNVLVMPVLLGGVKAHAGAPAAAGPLKPGPEIYQSIGVEPIINCRGTFTIIGGSVERPEVRAAMDAASKYFVQMDELAGAVGQRLAELTGAEWGMVSAGCAAGLKHVTAACVTGGNPEKLVRIPDLTGFEKTEVIIPRSGR